MPNSNHFVHLISEMIKHHFKKEKRTKAIKVIFYDNVLICFFDWDIMKYEAFPREMCVKICNYVANPYIFKQNLPI